VAASGEVLEPPGAIVPAQVAGTVTRLSSRVTAPFRAKSLPSTLAPVDAEIDVREMIVPTIVELVPRVVELVTCQKTLHGFAPFVNSTTLDELVMRVLSAWNIHTEFAFPAPLRVSVPVFERAPPL